MSAIKSARLGKTVCKREDEFSEWVPTAHPSISQAKRANGKNAITVPNLSALPAKLEKPKKPEAA